MSAWIETSVPRQFQHQRGGRTLMSAWIETRCGLPLMSDWFVALS